jgi:hypothetical protein
MTTLEALRFLISRGPGRTERQLSEAIYGEKNGYQQHVNQDCVLLLGRGEVKRVGSGGPADPYRYEPVVK